MYETRRRKPKAYTTSLSTQGIFNLPHHNRHGMRGTGPDDAVSYTVTGIGSPVVKITSPALELTELCPHPRPKWTSSPAFSACNHSRFRVGSTGFFACQVGQNSNIIFGGKPTLAQIYCLSAVTMRNYLKYHTKCHLSKDKWPINLGQVAKWCYTIAVCYVMTTFKPIYWADVFCGFFYVVGGRWEGRFYWWSFQSDTFRAGFFSFFIKKKFLFCLAQTSPVQGSATCVVFR